MVGLLVDAGDAREAFRYAEQAKGRVLFESLRQGRPRLADSLSPEERATETRLVEALAALNQDGLRERAAAVPDPARLSEAAARLEQARSDYASFRSGLYAARPELRARRGELPSPRLDDVALLLGPRGALLEYVVDPKATHLFVLTPAAGSSPPSLRALRLDVTAVTLAREVEAFRASLAERSPAYVASARRLYDLLVRPVEESLRGREVLTIVPDGPLWGLPFQALMKGRRHLLEDHALHTAPSLSVLAEMQARRRSPRSPDLVALGDPLLSSETVARVKAVYRDADLSPLPESAAEVRALAPFYGPASRVFTGPDAREAVVKAEGISAAVLHVASHGILDGRRPLYSHLVLARAQTGGEDGVLEAREIMDLDLRAELAVLSACETGRGRVGGGEGVIGMSWAFFLAGCPSTVVSLWKVDSESTTRLMVEFHRRLTARGNAPPTRATALRGAALELLRTTGSRHPFFWAGFSVVGLDGPLVAPEPPPR
jgi:CHAT domain-containing protein